MLEEHQINDIESLYHKTRIEICHKCGEFYEAPVIGDPGATRCFGFCTDCMEDIGESP